MARIAKKIFFLRHSDKDGNRITKTGFKNFFDANGNPQQLLSVLPDDVTDAWTGTSFFRTQESLIGYMTANQWTPEHLHEAVVNMGSEEQVKQLIESSFEELAKEHGPVKAFKLALGDNYDRFLDNMVGALNCMFDEMVGGIGIMFGHSPLIDVLAQCFGATVEDGGLAPRTGFCFELNDDGTICAAPLLLD